MRYLSCILLIILFKSCIDNSVSKEYYESGELWMIIDFHDEDYSCVEEYYRTGQLKQTGCLRNDILEGEVRTFFENGNLKKISNYTKGIEEGEVLFYNESGELIEKSFLLNGQKYYSEFFDLKETKDLITPLSDIPEDLRKGKKSKIVIDIPFDVKIKLPYFDKEIKLLWNLSKEKGTSDFYFDENIDSLLVFNKLNHTKEIHFVPPDTGTFFLNQLIYFDLQDSIFEYNPVELYVEK